MPVGLILCAGLGSRLKPLTNKMPKCMITVGNKPVLERIADHLNKHGIWRIVVNLHAFPEVVMKHFGQRFLYIYEPVPMGELATVSLVRGWFPKEKIVVANGDTLIFGPNPEEKRHCGRTYYWPDGVIDRKIGHDFIDIGSPAGLAEARKKYDP